MSRTYPISDHQIQIGQYSERSDWANAQARLERLKAQRGDTDADEWYWRGIAMLAEGVRQHGYRIMVRNANKAARKRKRLSHREFTKRFYGTTSVSYRK